MDKLLAVERDQSSVRKVRLVDDDDELTDFQQLFHSQAQCNVQEGIESRAEMTIDVGRG